MLKLWEQSFSGAWDCTVNMYNYMIESSWSILSTSLSLLVVNEVSEFVLPFPKVLHYYYTLLDTKDTENTHIPDTDTSAKEVNGLLPSLDLE